MLTPYRLYSSAELARITRVPKATIDKACRAGTLEGRAGKGRHGAWRIAGQAFEAWFSATYCAAPAKPPRPLGPLPTAIGQTPALVRSVLEGLRRG